MAKYRMRFVDIKGLEKEADEIKHIRLPEASAKKDKENVMTYHVPTDRFSLGAS